MLRAGANIDHLRLKVASHLERLTSLHVEETQDADGTAQDLRLSYDVEGADSDGRCSGERDEAGLRFRFVTTTDEKTLVTTEQGELGRTLAGRWVVQPGFALAEYCPAGPYGVTLSTSNYSGPGWLLVDASRVGRERVEGRQTVHFRQTSGRVTIDSWIAADGPETRVIKLVTRFKSGRVTTQVFSEFDSAGPVEPEPDPDLVVSPDDGAI